ncbi:hypothetical protein JCM8097_002902 [Rhodosporidiobolus ruineniae]
MFGLLGRLAGSSAPSSAPAPAPPAPPPAPVRQCEPCRRLFESDYALRSHLASPSHARRAAFAAQIAQDGVPSGFVQCEACGTTVTTGSWRTHETGERHRSALRFERFQEAQRRAQAGQHGVEVLPADIDFKHVEFEVFSARTEHANVVEHVEVRAGERACTVDRIEFGSAGKPGKKHFSAPNNPVAVRPHKLHRIPVHFTPRNTPGVFEDSLILTISVAPSRGSSAPDTFTVQRPIRAVVGCKSDLDAFKAKEPFVPREKRPRRARATRDNTVSAPRDADFKQNIPWTGKLPLYEAPSWLRLLLENNPVGQQVATLKRSLGDKLTKEEYGRFWSTMLQAERIQEELDIHSYDMESAKLQKGSKRTFFLDVPGLAEKRPSVLRGDKIKLRGTDGTGKWFEGAVVDVQLTRVEMRFHRSFNPGPSGRFDVQFTMSSIPTRRTLLALSQPPPRPELLFPPENASYPGPPPRHHTDGHRFFNPQLEANPYQREAVLSILYKSHGSSPFIIFGPPGTGKTVTLIESCHQLLQFPPSTLLLSAPSNAAADILCERLRLPASHVLRLNAPSRPMLDVPKAVRPFCCEMNGTFACPPLEKLKTYRVVVTTCISASILGGVGLKPGHFSHIFVDEAGQAKEPDTFLPISLVGPTTSVILAGDPKQLGPVVRSPVSSALGLQKSLLERLMEHPDYLDSKQSSKRGVTHSKLVLNYRSHPAILSLPNDAFYHNELKACASASVTGMLQRWDGWPNSRFPVIFHAVQGNDEREGRSPSFFNVNEITVARMYVERLQNRSSGVKLRDSDIGVITPYNAQVKKLRAALKRPEMTIGSVEQFQGSERPMIIMSTVRSNKEYLEHDKRFALGFLDNPKRFNVSITRAQAGLVVIGDPTLLALDPLWRRFLLYVHDNGGWAGQEWDADSYRDEKLDPAARAREEMDAFVRRFMGMGLDEVEDWDAAMRAEVYEWVERE